jgi:hypothetical protein
MRKKIGTALHEHLIVSMKELANADGVSLNELLEEAIVDYLTQRRQQGGQSFLQRTRGSVRLPPEIVEQIMGEDLYAGD